MLRFPLHDLWRQLGALMLSALGSTACVSASARSARDIPQLAYRMPQSAEPVVPVPATSPAASELRWEFQAASAVIAAPTACANGLVYVPTAEGAVHALTSDGAFRWTYNIKGQIRGELACDDVGNVYVGSTLSKLYVLAPDGQLRFLHHVPVGVQTNVVWSPRRQAFFGGADGRVWAVSTRAGVLWRSDKQTPPRTDLELDRTTSDRWRERGVFVGGAEAWWRVHGVFDAHEKGKGRDVRQLVSVPGRLYVVAADGLGAYDSTLTEQWTRSPVTWVAANERRVVAVDPERLCELAPQNGETRSCTLLDAELDGKPVLAARATVVPVSGGLQIVRADGSSQRMPLATPCMHRPVFDERTQNLYVVGQSGKLYATNVADWDAEPGER